MIFKVSTWNINSVRLRIDLVQKFLNQYQPDVLCLQETKCPQGQLPVGRFHELGYTHLAEFGQKGYHGVAIASKIPFTAMSKRAFCGKEDCRHVAVTYDFKRPLTLHNFYIPAGGDEPDPDINEKFAHKLNFLAELEEWFGGDGLIADQDSIMVGDLNIAPLEHDVWSHRDLLKVVSHTPVETDGLKRIQAAGKWVDVMRQHVPPDQKLYTWWSYRAKDWEASNRGRRLDHIWSSAGIAGGCKRIEVVREARAWPQPSDHVPVLAEFHL